MTFNRSFTLDRREKASSFRWRMNLDSYLADLDILG